MTTLQQTSVAQRLVERLVEFGSLAPDILAGLFGELTREERAALAHEWEAFWARPKQLPPDHPWLSWGGLTGKGFGKTRAMAELVTAEVEAGRARRVGLIAQNEDKAWEVLVQGESGLIAVSPPWFRAEVHNGRVVWPNGAEGFVYTPERPGDIHGPEHHLGWASEVHVWPRSTREQAWANFTMGLRLGYGRLIWDSNPSRKHPIIRKLLERSTRNPMRHVLFRGTTYENAANLTAGSIEEWEQEYGGTVRGRELLLGEQFDEEDGALVKQAWIDAARRDMPSKLVRRVIAIDPAISTRRGTDRTGIIDAGLGVDGQIYVIEDMSDRHQWEAWASLVIRAYFDRGCDCVLLERNRGGDACVANLRAAARELGIHVQVVELDAKTWHTPGTIYVKELVSRAGKVERAEPVAALYERGRVSHVRGADLEQLEEEWTTYEPAPRVESPNSLDACVFAAWELAGLGQEKRETTGGVATAVKLQQAARGPAQQSVSAIARLLGTGSARRL